MCLYLTNKHLLLHVLCGFLPRCLLCSHHKINTKNPIFLFQNLFSLHFSSSCPSSISLFFVFNMILSVLSFFCCLPFLIILSPSSSSSCVQSLPSSCITSSCPRLPGCSWRASISTACRRSSATSTSVPWGSTTPSAGACPPLSQVTRTRVDSTDLCDVCRKHVCACIYTDNATHARHINTHSHMCAQTHTSHAFTVSLAV